MNSGINSGIQWDFNGFNGEFSWDFIGFQWKYFGIKATWRRRPELTFVGTMVLNPPQLGSNAYNFDWTFTCDWNGTSKRGSPKIKGYSVYINPYFYGYT
jgi:hypothetical protein